MLRRVTSQFNRGELGEHQRQSDGFAVLFMLTIPSQAMHVTTQVARGMEGVSTRSKGNQRPTSAPHRSNGEEIVRADARSLARASEGGPKLAAIEQHPTFKRYSGLNLAPLAA